MTKTDILAYAAGSQSPRFVAWLGFILDWECAYARDGKTIIVENVAGDSGGRTFAGIDEASHPNFPYDNPTAAAVVTAYLNDAWIPCKCDQDGGLPFPVGEVVGNFAVNLGLRTSIKLLQAAIVATAGTTAADGSTLQETGILGSDTLLLVEGLDPDPLALLIDSEADARYRGITVHIPTDKKFLAGWLARDQDLDKWWESLEPIPSGS